MKQKDLAEEYLDRKVKQEPFKSLTTNFEFAFSANDIKAAFNAGRESVVESMPKLKWNDFSDSLENYYASCSIGWYYKVSYKVNEFELFCNGCFIGRFFLIEHAKQAANEHYKKQIRQVLEL